MTVYELIKALTAYSSDTEVYFRADGYVCDYTGNMEKQNAVEDYDLVIVEGLINSVHDSDDHPEIQCTVIY